MVPIVTQNFGFPYIVFNTKEGVLAKELRQAVRAMGPAEMLLAGFGDKRFFTAEPNFFLGAHRTTRTPVPSSTTRRIHK